MPTTLVEGNEHYDYVPIGSIVMDGANGFENQEVTSEEQADSTATVSAKHVSLAPTLVPNSFGKGLHGALCWDVQEWVMALSSSPDLEADQTNSMIMGISSGGVGTVIRNPDDAEYVLQRSIQNKNLSTAAGESNHVIELVKHFPNPMQIIEGNSFHKLLTKARYHINIAGSGNATARTGRWGMSARQVMVPLLEVFLDRDTIESLISFGVLAGILG